MCNVSVRMKGLHFGDVLVGFYKNDGSYAVIEESGTVVRFDAAGNGENIQKWPDFKTWLASEISILTESYKVEPSPK